MKLTVPRLKYRVALLEAMQERQVTLSEKPFMLPNLLGMGYSKSIEQEGTYPLPKPGRPFYAESYYRLSKLEEEKKIIRQNITGEKIEVRPGTEATDIMEARKVVAPSLSGRKR